MRLLKIDFRFLFYSSKKYILKIPFLKCQFTRKIPSNLSFSLASIAIDVFLKRSQNFARKPGLLDSACANYDKKSGSQLLLKMPFTCTFSRYVTIDYMNSCEYRAELVVDFGID